MREVMPPNRASKTPLLTLEQRVGAGSRELPGTGLSTVGAVTRIAGVRLTNTGSPVGPGLRGRGAVAVTVVALVLLPTPLGGGRYRQR